MLHGEERRRSTCRDTDLPVGALNVVVGGLDGDPERSRDLLRLKASGEQPNHLRLSFGQTRGTFNARPLAARRLDDGSYRTSVQATGANLGCGDFCCLRSAEGGALRTGFRQRVVRVGRGKQARGPTQRRTACVSVVAAPVDAFVLTRCDRREFGEKGRVREHALRVVRMQPHAFPLVRGQRPRALPDADRHRYAADLVHKRSAPCCHDLGRIETGNNRRIRDELRDTGAVPDEER